MRNNIQNKMIDHFIYHIGKLPESAKITILKKVDVDSHNGTILTITNNKTDSTYFVGIEKNFGDPIIEKLSS